MALEDHRSTRFWSGDRGQEQVDSLGQSFIELSTGKAKQGREKEFRIGQFEYFGFGSIAVVSSCLVLDPGVIQTKYYFLDVCGPQSEGWTLGW